ncbi:MAG: DUF4249 family protein [Sphingomonadales bacterium]
MRKVSNQYLSLISAFFAAIISFFSCKNDLNINAPWKETIVVYGMLNLNDSVQYVRVAKAFLNENSGALQVAKISDSLYLDSAVVTLRSSDNTFNEKLVRVWNISKDSGLFANDINPLYRLNTRGTKALDQGKRYILEVISPKSGNTVTAETNLVGLANIISPFRDSTSNFAITPEFLTISMKPGQNSFAYDIKLDITYDEFPVNDTFNKTTKIASWNVLSNASAFGNSNMLYKIPRLAFLQFLRNTITADPGLYHRLKFASLRVYGGNQLLSDYISVNEPSIGIVQKQAEFSNIKGGVGLFASRCIQKIEKVKFDSGSILFMKNNAETKVLNILP